MDTTDIIAAISAIVACIATLISYRIYRSSLTIRRTDRVLGLRVRTLELRSRLSAFMSKNAEVVRLDPDPQQDSVISNKAELILERLERLSALIKSRSTNLSEDELDEIELSLRECEGEMIPLEQKVDRILGKI